mgnify:CR=1 FL=1
MFCSLFSGNNHRGQADGFSLEILPKLKDIKSSKVRILNEYNTDLLLQGEKF